MDQRRKYHPTDFSGALWRRLAAFALARADTVEFALPYPVVLQTMESRLWPDELEAQRDALRERHVSLIRWELRREEPTQFARFRLTPGLRRFVLKTRRLEHWTWSNGLPEDPSLLVGDEPLLTTESAAGRIAVYASAEDVATLDAQGVRLLEPLGVKAEPWPTP